MLTFKGLDYEIYYNVRGGEEGNGIGFAISWDPSQTSTLLFLKMAIIQATCFEFSAVCFYWCLHLSLLLNPPCCSKGNGCSHYSDHCMIRLDSNFFFVYDILRYGQHFVIYYLSLYYTHNVKQVDCWHGLPFRSLHLFVVTILVFLG